MQVGTIQVQPNGHYGSNPFNHCNYNDGFGTQPLRNAEMYVYYIHSLRALSMREFFLEQTNPSVIARFWQ
jgi:hypothetical protein